MALDGLEGVLACKVGLLLDMSFGKPFLVPFTRHLQVHVFGNMIAVFLI